MREMTTAEFAKANLAALAEPVSVRRYTQVVGTYYPMGYEPASAPQLPLPDPTLVGTEYGPVHSLIGDLAAAEKHVRDLELEVKRLKQDLARRPLTVSPVGKDTSAVGGTTYAVRRTDDPFVGLAKQDREFFERKLGTGKKKS
jgi:hypothetical protein